VEQEELVTVDRFLFLGDAALAKTTLDADGIDAVLSDENIARMSWGEAAAHWGMRLQVRRSDAPLAMAMLTADDARSFDVEENAVCRGSTAAIAMQSGGESGAFRDP
jgi:hypothetical protein